MDSACKRRERDRERRKRKREQAAAVAVADGTALHVSGLAAQVIHSFSKASHPLFLGARTPYQSAFVHCSNGGCFVACKMVPGGRNALTGEDSNVLPWHSCMKPVKPVFCSQHRSV